MTYGTLTLEGSGRTETWKMDGIAPHVAIKLKHIFQGIPKAQGAPFFFPTDHQTAADLDWFLSRYPMEMSGPDRFTLKTMVARFKSKMAEIANLYTPGWTPPLIQGIRDGEALRWYQVQVSETLARCYGLLCGDAIGVGKTGSGIGACLIPGALPAAIIVQTHLQKQWKTQIERFTHLKVFIVKTTKPYRLPPADIYLFRYSQLAGWADAFADLQLKTVIYDEIQDLRTGLGDDPKKPIQKYAAAKRLSALCTYRLGLSGSPIFNFGIEMWNIMHLLRPEVLGPEEAFRQEWCGGGKSVIEPDALGTFLREQNAYLRRTRKDIGREMPKMNRILLPIEYDQKTMHNAEEMAHHLAVKASTGVWAQRGQAARELDLKLRQQTGIAKAPFIAEFLRMIVEGGDPVICGIWHRECYAIIMERLKDLKPLMYSGSESVAAKDRAKQAFIDGESDIMLISLRSGAGMDGIQERCSMAVIGEFDWSPAVHDQFFGRVDRDGQPNPVTGYYLAADAGSDPPMIELNGAKATEAAGINDPGLGPQPVHSDISNVQTLVNRYLHRQRKGA